MDFRRLHRWMEHFGLGTVGLPVEKNGEWEIPEEEKGLHASGHACGPDLLRVAREIQPEVLVPVHSEKPKFYVDNLADSRINIILPTDGGTLEI
jgi:ribonuclease J